MLSKPLTWWSFSLVAAAVLVALITLKVMSPRLAGTAGVTPSPSGLVADIVIPPKSMAAPDFTLLDQDGKPVSVSALRGRVVAITFLDSHCKQLCPLEGDQLGQVQRSLGAGAHLSVLVVSVAPATDTPSSERAFAATHRWSGDWHWLIGTPDQLAAVWKAYSIAVQNTPDNILHSSVLYLVDRDGFERAGWAAGLEPNLVTHDVRLLLS
ncbi:MAG: SCO family protein [Chloroflexi bacterium]|nr:MAG: SCO family protein [Chloroflexota bacterium]TMD66670.1 MAG: SCO family protein [Chloroflexota bacterium]